MADSLHTDLILSENNALKKEIEEPDIKLNELSNEVILKFHNALYYSAEAIFMTDTDELITYINPEFTNLYGYTAGEVINKRRSCLPGRAIIFGIDDDYERSVSGWLDLIHPDLRAEMDDYLTLHVIKGRNNFDREYRIIRKNDGQERWVYGKGELSFDSNNKLLSMIGTIIDITRQKVTEQEKGSTFSFTLPVTNGSNSKS